MRKFVTSLIFSLIMTLLSLVVVFLIQAPLMSFVYYGILSETNCFIFDNNIITKTPNTDTITIVLMICSVVLILGFVFALFAFVCKVINILLEKEKLVKPYYFVFFFMTTIVPVVLIFISIFCKVKLTILTLVVEGVFILLNIVLIIFSKKIFPDTTDYENRKFLFTKGAEYD